MQLVFSRGDCARKLKSMQTYHMRTIGVRASDCGVSCRLFDGTRANSLALRTVGRRWLNFPWQQEHAALIYCKSKSKISGPVAQWIRHRPTEPGIAGSSPAGVIYYSTNLPQPVKSKQEGRTSKRTKRGQITRSACELSENCARKPTN